MIDCPLCNGHNQLNIYENTIDGGQWFHCRQCQWCGDTIEFAAVAWNVEVPIAIRRLRRARLLPSITVSQRNAYISQYVEYRKQLAALLAEGEARLRQVSGDCRSRLRRYDIDPVDTTRIGGYAKLVRVVTKGMLRAVFKQAVREIPGGLDREIIIVPFYDLPGHVCGVLCLADDGKQSHVYLKIPQMRRLECPVAGVMRLAAVQEPPNPQLGHTYFVFQNIDDALRMYTQHFRQDAGPIPLCGMRGDPMEDPAPVWQALRPTDLVFCGPALTTPLINAARAADGRVAVYTPPREAQDNWHKLQTPVARLERLKQQAVPWRKALETRLQQLSPQDAEATLLDLQLSSTEMYELRTACDDPDIVELLRNFPKEIRGKRSVVFRGQTITETPDGWYAGNTLISQAIIRIDQITYSEATGEILAIGRVICRGREASFHAPAKVLSTSLFQCAAQLLNRTHRLRMVYNPDWEPVAFPIAQLFHPVEIVEPVRVIGWSPDLRCFVFPTFTISARGTVRDALVEKDPTALPGNVPKPAALPVETLTAALPTNDSIACAWAAFSAITANIVAPAVSQPTVGVLFTGDGAIYVGRAVAEALGCQTINAMRKTWTYPHHYPLIFGDVSRQARLQHALRRSEILRHPRFINGLAAFTWRHGNFAGVVGQWHIILSAQTFGNVGLPLLELRTLLPTYIRELAKRRFRLEWRAKSLAENILLDLAAWANQRIGPIAEEQILQARKFLFPAGEHIAYHFGLLVADLIRSGYLSMREPRTVWGDSVVYQKPEQHEVWIPHSVIETARLTSPRMFALDCNHISQALRDRGVLISEEFQRLSNPAHDRKYWVVKEEWWNTIIAADRRRQ